MLFAHSLETLKIVCRLAHFLRNEGPAKRGFRREQLINARFSLSRVEPVPYSQFPIGSSGVQETRKMRLQFKEVGGGNQTASALEIVASSSLHTPSNAKDWLFISHCITTPRSRPRTIAAEAAASTSRRIWPS